METLAHLPFRQPWLLLAALAAIPVFLIARRAPGRVVFSSLRLLPRASASWRMRLAWVPDLLVALAAGAMGVAAAGPRLADRNTRVRREGIAIQMVIDISGSMRALDLSEGSRERTRLDAVKEVFEHFVSGGQGLPGRSSDAVGLVTFARYADTRCPLTLDHGNLVGITRQLQLVTDRDEDGTAIGDGLGLAVERLRESSAKSRIAILLTDGVNNTGAEAPLAAAELARTQGVKVYTVGAGTNGVAPVRVQDPFTGRQVLQPVPVEIDEKTLTEIAQRTGGRYFRATDAEALKAVYREIDRLERTELVEERYREYHEYYGLVLGLGLVLAALAWLARTALFRRLP